MDQFLIFEHISKAYPGVLALDDVSLALEPGEVHALMGANGAGKTTLIKVLAGAETPSGGTIRFEDKEYASLTPALALSLGIGVVYQEHNLVSSLTVMENLFIGRWPGSKLLVDKEEMRRQSRELLRQFDIGVDPATLVEDLSPALQQIVEIVKTASRDLKLLVLDDAHRGAGFLGGSHGFPQRHRGRAAHQARRRACVSGLRRGHPVRHGRQPGDRQHRRAAAHPHPGGVHRHAADSQWRQPEAHRQQHHLWFRAGGKGAGPGASLRRGSYPGGAVRPVCAGGQLRVKQDLRRPLLVHRGRQ